MLSERFTVATEILVVINEKGSFDATIQGVKILAAEQQAVTASTKSYNSQAQNQAYLIRRVAMDLRMLSIGLSTLKREYGGINPVIDITISAFSQVSAAMSVVLGAASGVADVYKLLQERTKTTGQGISGLSTALMAGQIGLMGWAAAVVIAAGAALVAGTWMFEWQSGVGALRGEIRGLEEDIKGLSSAMRNLNVEQSALNSASAKNQAIIATLKREIELTGDPTGILATQLKAVTSESADLSVKSSWVAAGLARTSYETTKAKDAAADYQEAIDKAIQVGTQALFSIGGGGAPGMPYGMMGAESGKIPGQTLGGSVRRSGVVSVEAGEVIMQREQTATMMGQAGGNQSVSISLAGANIYGITNFEEAMRRGANAAGQELERLRYKLRSRY